jgi:hypothetical protein
MRLPDRAQHPDARATHGDQTCSWQLQNVGSRWHREKSELDNSSTTVEGTAIDVPAKPRHQRVLHISVTADIYPVVQSGWRDEPLQKLIKANGSGG